MSERLNNNLYCQVFVSGAADREALAELILQFADDAVRGRFFEITTGDISVDVRKNDFYDADKIDFIHAKYYLDVNAFSGTDQAQFLKSTAELLVFLKAQGYGVVPACDWEDELARIILLLQTRGAS
jgi:hypothetical protein